MYVSILRKRDVAINMYIIHNYLLFELLGLEFALLGTKCLTFRVFLLADFNVVRELRWAVHVNFARQKMHVSVFGRRILIND